MDGFTISISKEELTAHHNKEPSESKTILAGKKEHLWLKTYAVSQGVSVKALINCFAEKLQKESSVKRS